MVDTEKALKVLGGAKSRNAPWPEVAQAVTELESSAVLDEHGRAWARVAAERTGYSLNQLRQMQRTLQTLEKLQRDKTFDLQRVLNSFPFSHVEILARIAKASEADAVETINSYFQANRLPTYRELRERFYSLREQSTQISAIAAGQKAAREFERGCFDLLSETKAAILPGFGQSKKIQIIKWPGAFRYASPDIIIGIRNAEGNLEIDAVDCYPIYGDISQDETARRVVHVATESTFFRRFWILLPTWSVGWLVASMCEDLKLTNIGVVDVDLRTHAARKVRKPTDHPTPDRRDMMPSAVAKYFTRIT